MPHHDVKTLKRGEADKAVRWRWGIIQKSKAEDETGQVMCTISANFLRIKFLLLAYLDKEAKFFGNL